MPVKVQCTAKPVTWTLGGTVTGLSSSAKSPLVVSSNIPDEAQISNPQGSQSLPWQFTNQCPDKFSYTAQIKTQPDGQTCIITSGASGTCDRDQTNSIQIQCA
eukprot:TRINITY_DN12643_c0_g3_i1.p1 TRINITY_DN12643_c0_g3~~TRINITY_DN12643_c0_g3_i1.p1  ORF type:complete len:103 (+),score=14.19 TRINITY_DN12643_c0_g3_i1:132-440(+)